MNAILDSPPLRKRSSELPVLGREMRSTMRGRRLIVRLAVAGLLPVALCLLLLWITRLPEEAFSHPYAMEMMAGVGRGVFLAMVGAEFLLILFVAPGLTACAFTAEMEKQTLESLYLTPLSSMNLALGKLLCAVAIIMLLLLCAFPIIGVASLYGGVTFADLWWTQGILVCTLLFITSLGLYCSTLARRTAHAILQAYLYTFVLFLGPVLFLMIFSEVYYDDNGALMNILLIMAAMLAAGIATPVMHGVSPWVRGRFVRRLRERWWALFVIWLLTFSVVFTPLHFAASVLRDHFSDYAPFVMTGNPLLALAIYAMSMFGSLEQMGVPSFAQHGLLPTTILILLLGAALFFWAAVQKLNVLRRPE